MSTIFALDIGTRSVVGVILQEMNGTYQVVEMILIESRVCGRFF